MLNILTFAVTLFAITEINANSCCKINPIRPKKNLNVAEAFKEYKIVGDYIKEPPTDLLKAGFSTVEVTPGTILSPLHTMDYPYIYYPNACEGELYTIMLLDIDSPSPSKPSGRAYINGIIVNCPAQNLFKGDVIVPLTPANPALRTGLHRYVALMYRQNAYMDIFGAEILLLARDRQGFSIESFIQQLRIVIFLIRLKYIYNNMITVIAVFCIFISSVYTFDGCYNIGDVIQPEGNLSVSEAFRVYKIVPEYIFNPPDDLLVAGYPDVEIRLGTKFSPVRTIDSVYLNYPNGAENEMYTVMLLDIDARTRYDPEFTAYIHGMFLNSPASNLLLGDQIVPYVPAQPMPGTGYHRYVGLLYQQSEYLNPNQTMYYQLARQRTRFSAMDFATVNNLEGPKAGNFFLAEYTMCENC
ncbi:unnamed protein product [Colias eurytheme]|nr:unnamed protein product [Colias eurytheme]